MICQYCNHEFGTNSALKNHQRTAIYCLELRNENFKIACIICNKEFSKRLIKKHIDTCKENQTDKLYELFNTQKVENKTLEDDLKTKNDELYKIKQSLVNKINENLTLEQQLVIKDNENYAYNKIIHQNELLIKEYETKTNMLESLLKKYEEKLELQDKEKFNTITLLANKVGNTTNTVNNIKYSPSVNLTLSPEYLQQKLELYDETHYSKGVAGAVEWAMEHVAPDINYGCADASRNKFTFVSYEGGIGKGDTRNSDIGKGDTGNSDIGKCGVRKCDIVKGGVDIGGDKFKYAIQEPLLPHMKKYSQKRMAEINKSGKSDAVITELLIAEADLYDENKDLKHFSMHLARKAS